MLLGDRLARLAYKAYGDETGWKNFRGDPMPAYDALPETIKAAWRKASLAAVSAAKSVLAEFEEEVRDQISAALLDPDFVLVKGSVGPGPDPSSGRGPHGAEADCG